MPFWKKGASGWPAGEIGDIIGDGSNAPILCADDQPCRCCTNCSGETPQQMQVEIPAGAMANDGCANCADLEATYTLDKTEPGSGCLWEVSITETCGFILATLVVDSVAWQFDITDDAGLGADLMNWRGSHGGTPTACHTLSAFALSLNSDASSECNFAGGSQVEVTSL